MYPMTVKAWYDSAIISGIISVAVGVVLAYVVEWVRSNKRRDAHWSALATEVRLCRKTAQDYVSGDVQAPLYRMPLIAFTNSFGDLVANGALDGSEFRDLSRFYSWVEDINRGLDLATAARYEGPGGTFLRDERKRLVLKAKALINEYFPAADGVVRKHCKKIPEIPEPSSR